MPTPEYEPDFCWRQPVAKEGAKFAISTLMIGKLIQAVLCRCLNVCPVKNKFFSLQSGEIC